MASQPLRIFFDRTANILRDASGSELTNQLLWPSATLGMKLRANLLVVTDDELTPYAGIAAGAAAHILVDNDYSNPAPLIDLEAGDGNWEAGTGNEYYYAETDDVTASPASVWINGAQATEGTVGSLAQGEWGWDSENSRLYVRMSDDSDPDDQTDGYIEYKPDVTTTKAFIEVDTGTINESSSWYQDGVGWRDPDIAAGEISFVISANTPQFYRRIGTNETKSCVMQVQILEVTTAAFIDMYAFNFLCRNRFLPTGAEVEVEITNYYTKAEAVAVFVPFVGSLDIEIDDATKGPIQSSPNGTRWRLTLDNNGIPSWTSL